MPRRLIHSFRMCGSLFSSYAAFLPGDLDWSAWSLLLRVSIKPGRGSGLSALSGLLSSYVRAWVGPGVSRVGVAAPISFLCDRASRPFLSWVGLCSTSDRLFCRVPFFQAMGELAGRKTFEGV